MKECGKPTVERERCKPLTAKFPHGELVYDGDCLTFNTKPINDWVYGVRYEDGVPVELMHKPPRQIVNPPICAPEPGGCYGDTGSGGSLQLVDSQTNLSKLQNGRLLTELYTTGTELTGSGTQSDPLKINIKSSGGTEYAAGDYITISTSTPKTISFDGSRLYTGQLGAAKVVNGLIEAVDEGGDGEGESSLKIQGGAGIDVTDVMGVPLIQLETLDGSSGTYRFGRMLITVDQFGRTTDIEHEAELPTNQRSVPTEGGVIKLDADGTVTGVTPLDNSNRFTKVFIYKHANKAVTQTVRLTFPRSGMLEVYGAPFTNGQSVTIHFQDINDLNWVVPQMIAGGRGFYETKNRTVDLRFTIPAAVSGTIDNPRTQNAHGAVYVRMLT